MEILQVYQTKNRSYTKNRAIKPIGILVHSTGANNRTLKRYVDAPDRLGKNLYNNHWNKSTATKSVHAFIGLDKDQNVIVAQTLPYDRACWGAGGGKKGSANYDPQAHLQFEICQGSKSDSDYYWKAITVAEEYCAYLCKEFGWSSSAITSHKEAHAKGYASNHGDPISWMKNFGDDMDKFRERVAERLGEDTTKVVVTKQETVQDTKQEVGEEKTVNIKMTTLRNGSKGNQVKTLQRLLTAFGFPCGEVDGIFGAKTLTAVKDFQKSVNMTTDGIVGLNTWTKLLK